MKPGDAVTCSSCGASGRVWSTGAQHRDGWPVLVTWLTPGGERTMVEDTGPATRPLACRACGAEDPRAVVVHSRGEDGAFEVPAVAQPTTTSPARHEPPPGQLGLFGGGRTCPDAAQHRRSR